jgi:hypothetical protein
MGVGADGRRKAVAEDGVNDTADLQWFTRSVMAQALTNGYCAIPIVAGPCPHPNACLNCAHFRTDATFLEVHRAELNETERVLKTNLQLGTDLPGPSIIQFVSSQLVQKGPGIPQFRDSLIRGTDES